jgi:hypothetical protein
MEVGVMQEISQLWSMGHGAILDCGSRIDERRKARTQNARCRMQDPEVGGQTTEDR